MPGSNHSSPSQIDLFQEMEVGTVVGSDRKKTSGVRKETCDHCGASMMVNKYTMNRTLLRALVKIAQHPNKRAREIGLTKSEYSVYTKLKYWNFIRQLEDGLWKITDEGRNFLAGRSRAAKEIHYFRNRLTKTEGEVSVWGILPSEESKQKYRELMEPWL